MKNLFLAVLFLSVCSYAQTRTTASQEGDNAFAGNNTHAGTETFNGPVSIPGNVSVGGTLGAPKVDGICYLDGTTNATLAAAITCASTSGTIEIPPSAGTVSVSVNATIPAGVTLRIDKGAVLAIANAVTVTINGPFSTDGAYQVFSLTGTGTVVFATGELAEAWPQWWGGAGDAATDNTPALNAAIAASCPAGGVALRYTTGQFFFNSKPNAIGCGIFLRGIGNGSTQTGGTWLIANYNEATCASATACNGFLTWDGSFSTNLGTGGGLGYISVATNTAKTGGALVKLTGADDNHRAGFWRGDHINLGPSAAFGTSKYDLLVDGHNNTTAGSQGIRDVVLTDAWMSMVSQADTTAEFVNCAKCSWYGGEVYQGSGSTAGVTVTGTGGAGASPSNSVEVTLVVTMSGDYVVDQASSIRAISEHVLGNVNISANTANSSFIGRVDGTVTNSSASTVVLVEGLGGTNNTFANVGGPIGAVASGQTPPTQTAGALFCRTGAATCAISMGDGSCFLSMTAAGTLAFNCGNSGAFSIPGTNSNLKVPVIISTGTAAVLTGTGACATFSTQTGGSSAGRATCTGVTAASTLTITPGITAPNGWVCSAFDQTTRANLLQQTATVAASCTLTATSVTQNDVIVFSATAF